MIRAVIIYDISDDKRRIKLSDLLGGYGKRVNRSVFECLISSQIKLHTLKESMRDIVDKKQDSVRVYTLCLSCIDKSSALCHEANPFEEDAIYFF